MKYLEKQFIGKGQVKGDLFTQVEKSDFGFIYSVTFPEEKTPHHYEVFKRKIVEGYDFEKKCSNGEEMESYPTENSFGVWAFTCHELERAKEILNSFVTI
tara:strand:- start:98 stop:397 length:300 start_codon:yes stop_codon:yes gene_type:complete